MTASIENRLQAQREVCESWCVVVDEQRLAARQGGEDPEAVLRQARPRLAQVDDRVGETGRTDPLQGAPHGDDLNVDALVREPSHGRVGQVRGDRAPSQIVDVGAAVVVPARQHEVRPRQPEGDRLQALDPLFQDDVGRDERAGDAAGT